MEKELVIPLPWGGSLCCGEGELYKWGGYVRVCDRDGNEILYYDKSEWELEPESVMGALLSCADTGYVA